MRILIIAIGAIAIVWLVATLIAKRGNFFRTPAGAFVAGVGVIALLAFIPTVVWPSPVSSGKDAVQHLLTGSSTNYYINHAVTGEALLKACETSSENKERIYPLSEIVAAKEVSLLSLFNQNRYEDVNLQTSRLWVYPNESDRKCGAELMYLDKGILVSAKEFVGKKIS